MLQNIREKFTGWIAISILALIGVTFVFVGGANFVFVGNNYAAKVGDSEIGINQFNAAYNDQIVQNPQLAQASESVRMQLRTNVLEQLIEQRVIDNYLEDAGYRISDEQIARIIQQTPDFHVDGKFSMEKYRELLLLNGYDPTTFENAQRVTLRRNQLQRALRGSALLTPAAYRRYLNLATEQRIATLATIDPETVTDEISITDEKIVAFYDENTTLFQVPETADVEYIEVLRSDIAQGIGVSEEELADYYEINKDRYLQEEQRQARHVLVLFNDDEDAAEAKANELLSQIQGGASFADVAREHSADTLTADQGGDLGFQTQSALDSDLAAAIFSMEEGEIEGPVKSEFGFHIVRLDQISQPGPLPLEQVRSELTIELQQQKAESRFRELESRVSSELFDAPDLETLAEAVGLEIKSAPGFTRRGNDTLGTQAAIIDAVFDEAVISGAQISDIVEVDADRSVVVAVTNHRPATRQPLEDVRDQVVEALRQQQAEELMAARADEMLAAIAAGTDFAEAAASVGATAAEPMLMSRSAEGVDDFVSVAVFTAVKPTQDSPTTGSTRNAAGGYTVYSLDAVIPGRPEILPQDQRDAGKLQLTDQTGIGDFVAFIMALRENAEVVINEDVLAGDDLL